ncbi:hypothetical protein SUNI508_05385 [Seiridium unicorne]|uniref:Uncharacterized protein n=1 Tax=Seiridium unicorne TaxID=138068 RepID=A0ABR2V5E1_9PEZI
MSRQKRSHFPYEQFLLREMPPRLRTSLEQELQTSLNIADETLKKKGIDTFASLQCAPELCLGQASNNPANDQQSVAGEASGGVFGGGETSQDTMSELLELDFNSPGPFEMLGDADLGLDGKWLINDILSYSTNDGKAAPPDSGYDSNNPSREC